MAMVATLPASKAALVAHCGQPSCSATPGLGPGPCSQTRRPAWGGLASQGPCLPPAGTLVSARSAPEADHLGVETPSDPVAVSPLLPLPRPEDLSVPSLLRRDGVLPPGTAHRGVPEGREALPSRVSARPPCLPLVAWRGVAWAGRVGRYFPDTLGPAHTHPERSRHASPATVRVPRMGLGGGGQRGGEATAPPGAGPPSRRCPRRGSEG